MSFFFSFSVLKTNRDIGVGNRIYLIDAVYDTSEFESASSKSSQRGKATRYAAINVRIRTYGSVRDFSLHVLTTNASGPPLELDPHLLSSLFLFGRLFAISFPFS